MKEISNKTRSDIIQNKYTSKSYIAVGDTAYRSVGNGTCVWWLPTYSKRIIGPKALTVWSS